jgi:hypothetical protein
MWISIFVLKANLKRAYNFRKEEYVDGDVIHIVLAQEVSFLNKAAIKSTLMAIPENSKVIINAEDTVYIAHDILDLIREFKTARAKDENIKVKLIPAFIKIKCKECDIMLNAKSLKRHYTRKHTDVEFEPYKLEDKDMNDISVINARKKLEKFLLTIDDNNIIDIYYIFQICFVVVVVCPHRSLSSSIVDVVPRRCSSSPFLIVDCCFKLSSFNCGGVVINHPSRPICSSILFGDCSVLFPIHTTYNFPLLLQEGVVTLMIASMSICFVLTRPSTAN